MNTPNTQPNRARMASVAVLVLFLVMPVCLRAQSVAFSFDDGFDPTTQPEAPQWNAAIIAALDHAGLKSIQYANGMRVGSPAGLELLRAWASAGHEIGNHTYSHRSLSSADTSLEEFIADAERNEKLLRDLPGWTKRFRFPYLKEGQTIEKRDGFREWLRSRGYGSGQVSIDNSDWYYNTRYLAWREKNPSKDPAIFRAPYLTHLWNRAVYYDSLAKRVEGRSVKHVLLMHMNAINAAFLPDVIAMFKAKGWGVINVEDAYSDPIYAHVPHVLPAGESRLWSIAKEQGAADLRYPAEDGPYEQADLDALESAASSTAGRSLVVTIDDLPYASPPAGDKLAAAKRTTEALLRTLRAHRVPAIGFVTEGKLQRAGEVDAREALLKQWVAAGMLLGNHTFSHPHFSTTSVDTFEDEIVRGDVFTRRLMKARQPYQLYFRHPFTETGDTREKKEAVERFLAARSYKVTPHTIDSNDYMFLPAYADAKAKHDSAGVRRVREAYLAFLAATTDFAEAMTPRVFGRDIPQTLLIHANDVEADNLDDVLKLYAARGYRFISLDEAMADPAYQTPDTLVTRYGPSWLWRWSRSLGQDISFRADPEPPDWIMKAYKSVWIQQAVP